MQRCDVEDWDYVEVSFSAHIRAERSCLYVAAANNIAIYFKKGRDDLGDNGPHKLERVNIHRNISAEIRSLLAL